MRRVKSSVVLIAGTLTIILSACHKKPPVASAPPPAQAAAPEPVQPNAPTIHQFAIEPGRIERGQSAVLQWQVMDATEVEIDQDVGSVSASGRRTVSPGASTTYTLNAKGPGGTAQASATIDVSSPPPPPAPVVTPPAPSLSEVMAAGVRDAYFDFDKYNLRPDAMAVLAGNADALKSIFKAFPDTGIVVEGHCDERGSAQYNLGLADRRAAAARDYLEQAGLPGDRLMVISYGKERPQCSESNETCWQKNRRVHFVPGETQRRSVSPTDGSSGEPDR